MLNALRDGTRAEHEAIEAALSIEHMSRAQYVRLLERFRGYYGPLERTLASFDWGSVGIDFDARRKVTKLERDLAVLGGRAIESADVPALQDLAEAFGALYVIEGASLGGQIISRMLRERWEMTPERGGAFFYGYGPETGAMWRSFCAAISAFAPEGDARIVSSAVRTFVSMRAWCA